MEVSPRESHALAVASRKDLCDRVRKQTAFRINTCRSHSKGNTLTDRDISIDLPGTTQLGFYRALLTRFAAERDLTPEWWITARREAGFNGRDTRADHGIILDHFPEFASYYPVEPISDDEIVAGASEELTRWVSAPGSDYHQTKLQRKMSRDVFGPQVAHLKPLLRGSPAGTNSRNDDALGAIAWDINAPLNLVDNDALAKMEASVEGNDTEDDSQIFGAYTNRIAMLAMRHYGPVYGLYWFCEQFFLKKKYSDVLRILGGTEAELGRVEFERVKKHMTRNLPVMNENMLAILRTDPVLNELREPARSKPTASEKDQRSLALAARERQQSNERQLRKLLSRLDGKHAGWLREQDDSVKAEWIAKFRAIGSDESRWSELVRAIRKVA